MSENVDVDGVLYPINMPPVLERVRGTRHPTAKPRTALAGVSKGEE